MQKDTPDSTGMGGWDGRDGKMLLAKEASLK